MRNITAWRTHTKNALGIICIGTTRAETYRTYYNIAETAATTTPAVFMRLPLTAAALIMHTNFARQIIFTGTTRAELNKIYFLHAQPGKPANMANVSRLFKAIPPR
jgi:hypothetical protein